MKRKQLNILPMAEPSELLLTPSLTIPIIKSLLQLLKFGQIWKKLVQDLSLNIVLRMMPKCWSGLLPPCFLWPQWQERNACRITDMHFIEKNSRLQYLIRFQNTGTDTTYKVRIQDEISDKLDLQSLGLKVQATHLILHWKTAGCLPSPLIRFIFSG